MALNPDYPDNPNDTPNQINPENIGFVRPRGYLAIVLVTDEDDCSAGPDDSINDSMFMQTQNPITETASLRCAARGHVCGGQPIPGYEDPSIGYQPPNPLPAPNVGFSTAFANCAAKDQPDPNHPDHHYLPLYRVQDMIDSINGITAWVVDKNGNYVYDANGNHLWVQKGSPDGDPSHAYKILVSGIIGWPPDPNTILSGVQTSDQYQIGIDGTSLPVPQNTYWDYMPICSIPSIKSADGNIYKVYGGLRLKKFLDAFQKAGTNGPVQNTFSMCNQDFTDAMIQIGNSVAQVLKPGCVPYPLVDTDPSTPGVQPECQVIDQITCDTPGRGNCLATGYEEYSRAECKDSSGLVLPPTTTPQLANINVPDDDAHRPCWYLYYDTSPTSASGCGTDNKGERITVLRRSGQTAPAGTLLKLQCFTCPTADETCSAE